MKRTLRKDAIQQTASAEYGGLIGGIAELLNAARRTAARTVNALMTATYWEIGRRIVEFEQSGEKRAGYGVELLKRLADDLTHRFGRGFSVQNLENMRLFYGAFSPSAISETLSGKSARALTAPTDDRPISQTPSGIFQTLSGQLTASPFALAELTRAFPLPWSHYVALVRRSRSAEALAFYHREALRGGWSVRQLDRQIASRFYERTALSRDKAAMLRKGAKAEPEDVVSADDEVRDPFVLEFLGLKDEYSETDLEEALLRHLNNASPKKD